MDTAIHIAVKNPEPGIYIAYFISAPGLWEAASTEASAIGKLVISYQEKFCCVIERKARKDLP